jgi:glycosyltransferase 2 family protein
MSKKITFFLKIIFVVLIFYLILRKIDFAHFYQILVKVKIKYFVFMCLLWPVGLFISALRWKLFLKKYALNISIKEVVNLYWIGSFFNNFLPTSFGGDGYKFFVLNKKFKNKKSKILSSLILERGFGFFTIIIFIVFFGLFFLDKTFSNIFLLMAYFFSLGVAIISLIYLFISPYFFIQRNFKFPFLNKARDFINTLASFKENNVIVKAISLSILFLSISIFSMFLCFKAFGGEINFLTLLFLIPFVHFSDLIPFTINSLGVKEGLGIYLFSLLGINLEISAAVFLASRVLLALCTLTGGLKYIFTKK